MSLLLSGTNGVSDVDGSASTPAVRGTDTNTGIFFPAADTIAFAEGGTEVARFDSNGNLGIGTSSPSQRLTVNGGVQVQSTNPVYFFNTDYLVRASTGLELQTADFIRFTTNAGANERMRIDSSGNLLVGTTSATSRSGVTSKTVSVASGQDSIYLNSASNSYFTICSHVSTTSGTRYHIGFGDGTNWTERGTISTNGSSTTYSTSSDYRLKENIAPMTNALAVVNQLKPCTYTWKESGVQSQGFIAHELQEVVPECVTGEKDAVDAEGNPVYQGIDTSFLVATLTAAIQEQQAIIDSQASAIAALEARLTALEQV